MALNKGTALPFYRSLLLQKPGELNLSHHFVVSHIMPHFVSGVKLAGKWGARQRLSEPGIESPV